MSNDAPIFPNQMPANMVSIDNQIPMALIENKRGGRSVTVEPQQMEVPEIVPRHLVKPEVQPQQYGAPVMQVQHYGMAVLHHQQQLVPEFVPNTQSCENCASLVHLMFKYMIEMHGQPTSGVDMINQLSDILCYNPIEIQHMICSSEKPYRCRACSGVAFPIKHELQEHVRAAHAEDKSVACAHCHKSFKTKWYLKAHMKRMHEPKEVKPFRCMVSECGKEYANPTTFKRHVDTAHVGVTLHVNPVPNVGEFSSEQLVKQETGRGRGRPRGKKQA